MEFVIYPFSFAEFIELYHTIEPDKQIQRCFWTYLLSGGMPYPANIRYADEPSRQYLHDLFNSVQLKDIIKRNKIRDMDLLERIIAYVMVNVGNTFSATSLAKFLKNEQRTVAPETILNYIKYCFAGAMRSRRAEAEIKKSILFATNAVKSCMFRWPICRRPMRRLPVSLAHMTIYGTISRSMLYLWMSST